MLFRMPWAHELAGYFHKNFEKFADDVSEAVCNAGPVKVLEREVESGRLKKRRPVRRGGGGSLTGPCLVFFFSLLPKLCPLFWRCDL